MSDEIDDRLWDVEFTTEVSARYHNWRCGYYATLIRSVRLITIGGALIAILVAFLTWVSLNDAAVDQSATVRNFLIVAALVSGVIGVVNILAIFLELDAKALKHESLYRRFCELQERMARERVRAAELLDGWRADLKAIHRDEPETYWALYAMSWNQSVERHRIERREHGRYVEPWKRLLAKFVKFSPAGFPPAEGAHTPR